MKKKGKRAKKTAVSTPATSRSRGKQDAEKKANTHRTGRSMRNLRRQQRLSHLEVENARLRNELDLKQRTLIIIKDLADFLMALEEPNQTEILDIMLLRFAIEAVHAERGSLLKINKETKELYYRQTFTTKNGRLDFTNYSGRLKDVTYAQGEHVAGECLKLKRMVSVPDVRNHKGYLPKVDELLSLTTRSTVCMPIIVHEEVIEIIELTKPKVYGFTDSEIHEALYLITSLIATNMEKEMNFIWAITDSLTKLNNIHYFMKMFESELKKASRYLSHFTLMILDIDDFKGINDTYGHTAGDKILCRLAYILKSITRSEIDLPARYGGDEFVILLPATKSHDSVRVAEKIISEVRETSVQHGDVKLTFSVSVGLASFPDHGDNTTTLFEAADMALYEAKRKGKNTYATLQSPLAVKETS